MASPSILGKRKRPSRHPYLTGNFAPQTTTLPLTPCSHQGTIPREFLGGQYVRNGSNPVKNEDLGRDAHWFDGDGMLSGVYFTRDDTREGAIRPEFVNQYLVTDILCHAVTTPSLKRPLLPSIATLVNPLSSLLKLCWVILRAVLLVILSRLPGSAKTIKKMSVANTAIFYHDGRALATCESGPPLRVQLPSLDTVGWFNGHRADGEPVSEPPNDSAQVLGGTGVLSFMREWTTAHPKVDPATGEMLMFHSTPLPPFVHYTVIPAAHSSAPPARMNVPLPGVSSAKMMHDFGVSRHHTVIMDLPLSLDPLQLVKGKPIINYDSSSPSRFGVFPRSRPDEVRWFETLACCIFHTANTWDVLDARGRVQSVDLLACRLTSAAMVFTTGNIKGPQPTPRTVRNVQRFRARKYGQTVFETAETLEAASEKTPLLNSDESDADSWGLADEEDDQCRLHYYSFDMQAKEPAIKTQFALTPIPFEFPSTHPGVTMEEATYIYGCTSTVTSFNPSLGRASLIDCIAKINAPSLIRRGKDLGLGATSCVDTRLVDEILRHQRDPNGLSRSDIQIFQCPQNVYAQEPRFVPRTGAQAEDDGYLIFYTFDETQVDPETGAAKADATSEFWIIDARDMSSVIARVQLPQRVPYGLHGNWFSSQDLSSQRGVERVRRMPKASPPSARMRDRVGRRFINGVTWALGG